MATSQINDLYKSTLGRSADKAGLDYWSGIAKTQGMDAVKHGIAAGSEAKTYQSTGKSKKTAPASSSNIFSSAGNVASSIGGATSTGSRSPSSSSSSSTLSNSASVSRSINDLYQQNLGRSVDKAGLDYWTDIANKQGMDAVTYNIAKGGEANMYQQRGTGMTVSARDQVDGFNYRNTANLATQQARSPGDYGLLQSGFGQMVDSGIFSAERDDAGNTLYRSQAGGLYDIMGMPVQDRPTRSAPQSTVTPEQTSRYQLDQMLASDSPLMQRAATQGAQRANSRGLLNSSMASEAAQGAMIDRATPFAQQDAQTYFQNSQANTDRQQQAFMENLNHRNTLERMQQEFGFNSALSSQEANQALNQLYATSTANGWGVMANNLTDIIGQYSGQLERIQMNPDIGEEQKTSLIQQVLSMRDADLDFQRSMYDQLPNYLANTGVFPNR